jgi:hypothetical protein
MNVKAILVSIADFVLTFLILINVIVQKDIEVTTVR